MPLLDVFFTMLWFFCFFIWIMLLIRVFADIFRSHDLSGWGKAAWSIFVVFLPLLGVLVYVIARGGSMQKRQIAEAAESRRQMDEYVRQTAGTSSPATELAKLTELHNAGAINDSEFERAKSKLLAA